MDSVVWAVSGLDCLSRLSAVVFLSVAVDDLGLCAGRYGGAAELLSGPLLEEEAVRGEGSLSRLQVQLCLLPAKMCCFP